MSCRARCLFVGLVLLGVASPVVAAAPPTRRVDSYGDPLPRGAVARLGTVRWRHPHLKAFAFTRSGETLVSIDLRGIQFWDVKTGKVVRTFAVEHEFFHRLAMTPDGGVVVAGRNGQVVVHDGKTGKELWRADKKGTDRWPESATVTPDGSAVVVGCGDGAILFYDLNTGKLSRTLDGGGKWVCRLEFSDDGGTLLAVEAGRNGHYLRTNQSATVRVWDVKAGKQLRVWSGEQYVGESALSADGKTVANTGSRTLRLFDVASGELLPGLAIGNMRPNNVAFGPQGQLAVCFDCVTQVWDVPKKRLLNQIGPCGYNRPRPAFRRDGKVLAVGSECGIALIDLATGKSAYEHAGLSNSMHRLAGSGDGKLIAGSRGDGDVSLWDARSGRNVGTPVLPREKSSLWDLGFFRGSASLGFIEHRSSGQGRKRKSESLFRSWDIQRARPLVPDIVLGDRGRYAFDPRGLLVALPTKEGIVVHNLRTGKPWRQIPVEKKRFGEIERVSPVFAADGNMLAVVRSEERSRSRTVMIVDIWDLKLNQIIGKAGAGEEWRREGHVFAFAVYGRCLIGELYNQRVLRVWDLWDEDRYLRFDPLPNATYRSPYSVSSNGLWLAQCVDIEGKAHTNLIEALTGKVVLRWDGDQTFYQGFAWMPGGRRLVIGTCPPLVLDLPECAAAPESASLSGEKRQAALWADLDSKDAAVAFRTICWLASRPDVAFPLLEKYLPAGPKVDLDPIHRLVAQLGDDDFETRQAADAKLKKLGHKAKRLLEEAAGDEAGPLEQRRRARRLLDAIEVPAPTADQLRLDVRQLRALQVLEWIDSDRARRHLRRLGEAEPDAPLTRYARSALSLLAK